MRATVLYFIAAMSGVGFCQTAAKTPADVKGHVSGIVDEGLISPNGPAGATGPTGPVDPVAVGSISKETMLELSNLAMQDERVKKPLQEIADMLLGPNQKIRNQIIATECAKYGLDASKNECFLDVETQKVRRVVAKETKKTDGVPTNK